MILLALLVPTAYFARAALGLPVDVENRSLKAEGTPEAEAQAWRVERFGRGDVLVVAFEPVGELPAEASEAESAALAELADRVRAFPGVDLVRTWSIAEPAKSAGSGARCAWAIELGDGTRTATVGSADPPAEQVAELVRAGTPASLRPAIAGLPLGELAIGDELRAEQRRVVPAVALALTLLLFACYRSVGLVLAVLAPAGAAIAWTGGIHALLGGALDPVSVLQAPVLLTVGVASGVHWIEAYLEERERGLPAHEAARAALADLRMPAMLAALTTVVGFASLAFNSIPAVVDFGLYSALGVGLLHVLATLATPALLALLAGRVSPALLERRRRFAASFGRRAAGWVVRHVGWVRALALAVTAVSIVGWTRLEVDNDPLRVLRADHPLRLDTEEVAAAVGGNEPFDVLVPADSEAARPTDLALCGAAVLALPGVGGPAGPPLRTAQGDWALRFLLAPGGSAAREALFDRVEQRALALGVPEVRVAGTSVRMARDSGRLIRGALRGSAASLLVLFAVLALGFRSLRVAAIAIVPNALPCVVVYAGLAYAGRPLTFATAMICSVMLGLIVDDTIHLLHGFRAARAEGASARRALESVYARSGRAVVITSVVLGLGFAGGLAGRLPTTMEFSALASATVAVALAADLALLPALLVRPERSGALATEPARA